MKTKFYWVTLLASAALFAQAQAGTHHSGGGGTFTAAGPSPARTGGVPSFHSMPTRSFGGGRTIYSGQRFSAIGPRSLSRAPLRRSYIAPSGATSIRPRQFTPRNISHADRLTRVSDGRNGQSFTNPRRGPTGAGQVRSGNNLPTNWRNHVVAQHPADWRHDWNRSRDHVWHGRHCRFINGSWVIFDFGFYPWWPSWYPYDYYADGYYPYPYSYGPAYYDSDAYPDEGYYGQNGYDSSARYTDPTLAAAQDRLAREGYYRGEIDGILGPATRHAIVRYQRNQGLHATGYLTPETLDALGLRQLASY